MQKVTKEYLFGNLNFSTLDKNHDFKEDSVREVIILPILKELGYEQKNIIRSKTLKHPFLKIGSNKKRAITYLPDYSLQVEESFAWVLDAKAPSESVTDVEHLEQVYSYATHPEIRSVYFALCNGQQFSLYRTQSDNIPIDLLHNSFS